MVGGPTGAWRPVRMQQPVKEFLAEDLAEIEHFHPAAVHQEIRDLFFYWPALLIAPDLRRHVDFHCDKVAEL